MTKEEAQKVIKISKGEAKRAMIRCIEEYRELSDESHILGCGPGSGINKMYEIEKKMTDARYYADVYAALTDISLDWNHADAPMVTEGGNKVHWYQWME
jgi:hypothetical protein